jgi:hypothetical protein
VRQSIVRSVEATLGHGATIGVTDRDQSQRGLGTGAVKRQRVLCLCRRH